MSKTAKRTRPTVREAANADLRKQLEHEEDAL